MELPAPVLVFGHDLGSDMSGALKGNHGKKHEKYVESTLAEGAEASSTNIHAARPYRRSLRSELCMS